MRIAIVGAGFSGLLLALQLLRSGSRAKIILIDRAPEFGRGLAYATGDFGHLLNVRASNMSAFPDEPDHFVSWLAQQTPPGAQPRAFVPRHLFGTYLQDLLRAMLATPEGAERLIIVPDEAVGLVERPGCIDLRLGVGRTIEADHVVLATGNPPPPDPAWIGTGLLGCERYIGDPWAPDAFVQIKPADDILLIGAGLTAIDVLLGLDRRGHKGMVHAMSRRGLRPRAHAETGPAPATLHVPARPRLTDLVRLIRGTAARDGDWRAAADGLRPHIQRLWQDASEAERGRFLRHLRPWWDVHRHRIAPPVAKTVEDIMAAGRLSFRAGKIQSASLADDGITVTWRPRGHTFCDTLQVGCIINCTGPAGNVRRTSMSLLADLMAQGLARPDAQELGVDVDGTCRLIAADGRHNPHISAIGPMSRGAFWEMTAVPDIRVQACAVAKSLS